MQSYSWPGNVRELQNVIERAVITSRNGQLNLDRALPESAKEPPPDRAAFAVTSKTLRTATEMEQLERENLIAALERAAWQVAGEGGAAKLLGMKPTTLSSRMKALRIKRI